MTVRGLLLSLAVLASASAPVPAAARHCYSRWYYPFPQRCPIASHRTREGLPPPSFALLRRHEAPFAAPSGPDIPLPFLTKGDCEGGEADELTRARLMLRAALDDAHAH